jgi:hypothetical protein
MHQLKVIIILLNSNEQLQCVKTVTFSYCNILLYNTKYIQVTQPVGYVGTLPAIRINESMAEWTARDCYVSLLGGGTVYMSTCETMAEWTIRDCRYEYV